MKKKRKLSQIILPNKRINIFVYSILLLGIISGSIFLILTNNTDKLTITKKISAFFSNISNNNINNGLALRNSLIINYLFVFIIWFLGLSIIGIIINIFLTYIKGFLVGFSISTLFLTYKTKGLLAAIIYTIPSQILNIITVTILTIYSIQFSGNLLKIITIKKNNNRLMLKKYLVILILCIIISFISSIFEVYIFPKLLKLVISLYV